MKIVDKIFDFIRSLDEKQFLKYTYITIGSIVLVTGLITYRHFSKIDSLKKELNKINIARQEAQIILTKDVEVKRQKAIVDEILEEGKTFYILDYFNSVINQLGLNANIKVAPEPTTSELETLRAQGYLEVRLPIKLTDLNMKQLVDLIEEFEKNERIYTKSLEIIKSPKTPTIDVEIVIATLQPKTELSEAVE